MRDSDWPLTPYFISFDNSILWSMVSKAFNENKNSMKTKIQFHFFIQLQSK